MHSYHLLNKCPAFGGASIQGGEGNAPQNGFAILGALTPRQLRWYGELLVPS